MPKPSRTKRVAESLGVGVRHARKLKAAGDIRVEKAEAELQPVFALDDQLKAERIENFRLKNAELRGSYISRAEVYERETTLAAKTNAILLSRLVSEIPPLVAGLDAAAIRAEMEKLHARICGDFKKFSEEWK